MAQSYKGNKQWSIVLVLITAFALGTFAYAASTYDEKRVKKLSKQLTSKSYKKRQAAVRELAVMEDYRVVPLLLKAIGDRMFSIRNAAIDALGKINDPRAADPLLVFLREPWKKSVGIPIHQAIRALIKTKDSRAGECFLTHFNNTSYRSTVRGVAALALLVIEHQAAYARINDFMKGYNPGKYNSNYIDIVKKLIQIKDARFLDFYKSVMAMEGTRWRGHAARNVLELADKTDTDVLEEARGIAQGHSYIVEFTGYDFRKRPKAVSLSNVEGKRVAIRKITYPSVSVGSFFNATVTTIDIGTGKVIHEGKATVTTGEILTSFLCLDKKGNIILKGGQPVIIERFGAIRKSKDNYTYIGGDLVNRYRYIYPCKNCSKTTGIENCRYVW